MSRFKYHRDLDRAARAPSGALWALGVFNGMRWASRTSFHPDDLRAAVSWGLAYLPDSYPGRVFITDLGDAVRHHERRTKENPPP